MSSPVILYQVSKRSAQLYKIGASKLNKKSYVFNGRTRLLDNDIEKTFTSFEEAKKYAIETAKNNYNDTISRMEENAKRLMALWELAEPDLVCQKEWNWDEPLERKDGE